MNPATRVNADKTGFKSESVSFSTAQKLHGNEFACLNMSNLCFFAECYLAFKTVFLFLGLSNKIKEERLCVDYKQRKFSLLG